MIIKTREAPFNALAHAIECVSNGRHKSYYLHLFVFVVPLFIARYGNLWRFCTSALEYRNSRVKRQKISWRNGLGDMEGALKDNTPLDGKRVKRERDGQLKSFRAQYKSSPVVMMLRNVSAVEELRAKGEGVAGVRLLSTGRKNKRKMEPEGTTTAALGGSMTDFLKAVSVAVS